MVFPSKTRPDALHVFAPAKLNLDLYVTKRRADGYHALDSLVAFADIGDRITLEPSEGFAFEVEGPFARAFSGPERDNLSTSSNLAVKAVWALARVTGHRPDVRLSLVKNLPLGAGLGGGSADAAAVLWGLLQWWRMPKDFPGLSALMPDLGADVPVCFLSQAGRMHGVGDLFDPLSGFQAGPLPDIPLVLVYPGLPCSTSQVFSLYEGPFTPLRPLPAFDFETGADLQDFLRRHKNNLMPVAQKLVPDIGNVLKALETSQGCTLARMSGSGSSCFGLFGDEREADGAAQIIRENNPDWWVQSGHIRDMQRY